VKGTLGTIEDLLRAHFEPVYLEIRDESARHAGHTGAADGGGHYLVTLVSPLFEGRARIEQHREVNRVLGELIGKEIHALGLTTMARSEWEGGTE
jgi:BolA protein